MQNNSTKLESISLDFCYPSVHAWYPIPLPIPFPLYFVYSFLTNFPNLTNCFQNSTLCDAFIIVEGYYPTNSAPLLATTLYGCLQQWLPATAAVAYMACNSGFLLRCLQLQLVQLPAAVACMVACSSDILHSCLLQSMLLLVGLPVAAYSGGLRSHLPSCAYGSSYAYLMRLPVALACSIKLYLATMPITAANWKMYGKYIQLRIGRTNVHFIFVTCIHW